MVLLKLLGAAYFWLAYKAFRSALTPDRALVARASEGETCSGAV